MHAFNHVFLHDAQVPPHILADWHAIEASNCVADTSASRLLLGLIQSDRLKSLTFVGACCNSIKLVPSDPEREIETLLWLHGVTQQSTPLLYGMSGAELIDRMLDLRAAGQIPYDALEIYVGPDSCMFGVPRDGRKQIEQLLI